MQCLFKLGLKSAYFSSIFSPTHFGHLENSRGQFSPLLLGYILETDKISEFIRVCLIQEVLDEHNFVLIALDFASTHVELLRKYIQCSQIKPLKAF